MMTLEELKQKGYVLCLPQKIRLDTGLIGKLTCNLHCNANAPMLHVIPAKIFLSKGWLAVDDNGDLLSLLDTDVDRKLVLLEDISLYFALQQTRILDSNIAANAFKGCPENIRFHVNSPIISPEKLRQHIEKELSRSIELYDNIGGKSRNSF